MIQVLGIFYLCPIPRHHIPAISLLISRTSTDPAPLSLLNSISLVLPSLCFLLWFHCYETTFYLNVGPDARLQVTNFQHVRETDPQFPKGKQLHAGITFITMAIYIYHNGHLHFFMVLFNFFSNFKIIMDCEV